MGSFSLFRGLAEGFTGGVDNFTDFPESFLFLGQGYSLGGIPAQVPIFLGRRGGLLGAIAPDHVGRGLGDRPFAGRRGYAGLPVDAASGLVYMLAGLVASLAAIIYVAHLGQAKADAGTGYELVAITAVVLGGTSIFGGRGNVPGTLLGLVAIAYFRTGCGCRTFPPS